MSQRFLLFNNNRNVAILVSANQIVIFYFIPNIKLVSDVRIFDFSTESLSVYRIQVHSLTQSK